MDDFNEAKWNQSAAYCYELTILRQQLHKTRMKKDMPTYFDLLESYYIALSPLIKKKEDNQEQQTHYKNAKIALNNIHVCHAKRIGLQRKDYDALTTWEFSLRKQEDKLGLLIMKGDDPSGALMRGGFG